MKENTRRTIEYPGIGITTKPPWGAFIVLGNKRHENRGLSEAGVARKWIGQRIAITASKNYDLYETTKTSEQIFYESEYFKAAETTRKHLVQRLSARIGNEKSLLTKWNADTAGKIIGVAELVGVVRNGDDPPGYWQAAGQHSLVLGRVWEVEPVPCTGGQGVWKLSRCPLCGRPIANTYGTQCKTRCLIEKYPAQLTVKAEYGVDGEELWRAS